MAMLADFGREEVLDSGPTWPAFGREGWLVPATMIDFAADGAGVPKLQLSLTRGALPFRPPDPFARLDCTTLCTADLDAAAGALRARFARATATALWPDRSRIQMGDLLMADAAGDNLDIAGSRSTRMIRDLGWDGGLAAAEMLRTGANPLRLQGLAAFRGISPRAAVQVALTDADLEAIAEALPSQAFSRDELELMLLAQLEALEIGGLQGLEGTARVSACAALADRLFAKCGEPLGEAPDGTPLARLETAVTAPLEMDLSVPFETLRWVPAMEAPTSVLDVFLRDGRGGELVAESVLASFPARHHRLTVYTTFAAEPPDLQALGVTAQAAANPPDRPASATATGIVEAPTGRTELQLRLATGEPLSYTLSTFAVGQIGGSFWQSNGPLQVRNDRLIALGPGDFGVRLVEVTIEEDVLEMAEVSLGFLHGSGSAERRAEIALAEQNQLLALARVERAEEAGLSLREKTTGKTLELALGPLEALHVSFHLFESYGLQSARIELAQPGGETLGLDVRPIGAGDAETQTFSFSERVPARDYHYQAASPFAPGFEHRRLGTEAWHTHADPATPLVL